MMQVEQELQTLTVEGSAGGGAVKVVMTGKMKVEKVTIAPEAAQDVEMLQDMIVAAMNDGQTKAQELASQKLGAVTGGIKIPGLM